MDLAAMKERQQRIRNFSIVAHIDHGKSTLADRILEMTDTISKREMKNQILDDMPLERERGITIKLNAVALTYHAQDGQDYIFHLIDTPGHVDFSYEVSRSLAACEGAILVVDATQGVEAQTLANTYLAIDNDLEILPVINKVDLPSADPEGTKKQIEDEIGLDTDEAVDISAKTGVNVDQVLEKIVQDIPAPTGDLEAPLKALIFDSKYDDYRGVVLSVRVKEGTVKKGDKIEFMNSKAVYEVAEVGINSPKPLARDFLMAGDVGYVTAAIKDIKDARVGDTITDANHPTDKPLAGYRQMQPMVYAGLYPTDNAKFNDLRDALEKLQLNDAALTFEPESSQALGFGILGYAPLGRGVLTGKYRATIPPDSRAASPHLRSYVSPYLGDSHRGVVEAVATAASGLDRKPAEVALAWARDAPGIASTIVGARTPAQLQGVLSADDLELPVQIRHALDEVTSVQLGYPERF